MSYLANAFTSCHVLDVPRGAQTNNFYTSLFQGSYMVVKTGFWDFPGPFDQQYQVILLVALLQTNFETATAHWFSAAAALGWLSSAFAVQFVVTFSAVVELAFALKKTCNLGLPLLSDCSCTRSLCWAPHMWLLQQIPPHWVCQSSSCIMYIWPLYNLLGRLLTMSCTGP